MLLAAQSVGLFVTFFGYVSFRIRPELFYHQRPHIFLLDTYFFQETVNQPGGLVDYLTAFLSPLCAWDWLGALVITVLVAAICLGTRGVVAAISGSGGEIAYLVPAVLMVMVLGQYIHPVRLCVGLGVALLGANVYFRLGGCHVALRLALFLAGSALIYFTAAGMYVIFACLCGCYEWSVKRQRWFGVVWVLSAAAFPCAANWWPFDLVLSKAFEGLVLPDRQQWLAIPSSMPKAVAIYTAWLVFPILAAVVVGWRRKREGELRSGTEGLESESGPPDGGRPQRGGLKTWVEVPLAIVLLMLLADLVTFDYAQRCLLEIEANSEQRRWDDVLAWAERLPPEEVRSYDPRIIYCINRSLYFKGSLLDRMFCYPQVVSTPSLTLIYQDIDTTSRLTPEQCSEIFFDLGRVNESEQMAYEVLEHIGNRPEILKRLVWIYVIKGEPEAARRFLRFLERSLLHAGWARGVRRQLEADPSLSALPLIARQREMAVTRDSVGAAQNQEELLEGLLERNPRNRMALEYLMAHYLLTRQIDRVAANRHRFDALEYPKFPRHIEEALVCYAATNRLQELDSGTRPIDPETWQRLNEFLQLEQQSQGNAEAAFAALYPGFHETYFFSFVFKHNISSLGVARPPQ